VYVGGKWRLSFYLSGMVANRISLVQGVEAEEASSNAFVDALSCRDLVCRLRVQRRGALR
jgi:hypothetical protein